ncbi:response regulator transcription factor [Undibacterium piscinae]|jgi:DNA-binding LytR/AlgR family response regulator|uniref:Response regulator transcription factor n=1 Tax=Undibacterium piscinae TaxID=2495591 RepID=A0A6M4A7N3_9BURK|nr:response regulator transcription factor [Undibacterium piscinae]
MPESLNTLSAIIADDEAPMREQLKARLQEVWPELHVVAEAGNGQSAIEQAQIHHPDVIFLDIRMPGKSGIEAARQLSRQAQIVFVTAYDQYAIEAFEQGAIDYLLKPVDTERLTTTCLRLQQRLLKSGKQAPEPTKADQVEHMLRQIMQHSQAGNRDYLRWIQASVGSILRMVSTKEVLFFRADDKYTRVQTGQAEYLIRKTLKELEDELDPDEFWRIHRSTLVRVDAISEVTRDFRGRQLVQLKLHPEKLEVSRNHSHLFQQM